MGRIAAYSPAVADRPATWAWPASHERRAKSLFRYGCDFLRRTFCDLALRTAEFDQVLQLLSLY